MKSDAPIRRAKLRDLLAAYLDYQDSLNLSINTLKGMRYNNLRFLGWLENTHRVRYVDQLRRRYVPGWLRYLASYRTSRDVSSRLAASTSRLSAFGGSPHTWHPRGM